MCILSHHLLRRFTGPPSLLFAFALTAVRNQFSLPRTSASGFSSSRNSGAWEKRHYRAEPDVAAVPVSRFLLNFISLRGKSAGRGSYIGSWRRTNRNSPIEMECSADAVWS